MMDKPVSRRKWVLLGGLVGVVATVLTVLLLQAAGVLQLRVRWRDEPTRISKVDFVRSFSGGGDDCAVLVFEYRGGWIDCDLDVSSLAVAERLPGGLGEEVKKHAIANGASPDGRNVTGVLVLAVRRVGETAEYRWRCSLTASSPGYRLEGSSVREFSVRLSEERFDPGPQTIMTRDRDLTDTEQVVAELEWGLRGGQKPGKVRFVCRKLDR